MTSVVKIYFDGGCRPNPGRMELGVVIGGRAFVTPDAGEGTGMDAEWLALIAALRMAQDLAVADFVLIGDAAAVIDQARGRVRCPKAYRRHFEAFQALFEDYAPPRIRYVKRSQNLAGIALARMHQR